MRVLATGTLAIALMWSPAMAQNSRIVDGLVLNLGIVPAEVALRADGHRDAHPANPPSGSQHLLITVDDRNSGKRISDAEVSVEVNRSERPCGEEADAAHAGRRPAGLQRTLQVRLARRVLDSRDHHAAEREADRNRAQGTSRDLNVAASDTARGRLTEKLDGSILRATSESSRQ
jgi:hypothetical protein